MLARLILRARTCQKAHKSEGYRHRRSHGKTQAMNNGMQSLPGRVGPTGASESHEIFSSPDRVPPSRKALCFCKRRLNSSCCTFCVAMIYRRTPTVTLHVAFSFFLSYESRKEYVSDGHRSQADDSMDAQKCRIRTLIDIGQLRCLRSQH